MKWLILLALLLSSPAFGQSALPYQNQRRLNALLEDDNCITSPCDLATGTTVGGAPIGGGGGAPTTLDYLVGTATGSLSAEIVVGTSPGGELGGTWGSPTIDSDVVEELGQAVGETDLRYDATAEAYYYDVDGDSARDTDGTEQFIDMRTVEVPGDYLTIQDAIDSNDCKKGSTTANQGCIVRIAPGTYAEVFEIGSTGTTSADYQNSIIVEGAGFNGVPWTVGGNNSCVVTLTGNNVLNHDTITVNGSLGWSIRNLCIDMDASATNDTRYGIAVGTGGAVTKHGLIENVSIVDNGASGGAGIRLGDGASSDVAFNTIHNVYMRDVRKCIQSSGNQVVGNNADNVSCSSPTDSVGCIDIVSGQLSTSRIYCRSGADSQIGIQIGATALSSDIIDPTFEWYNDNGTFIKYDASISLWKTNNIRGGRFKPINAASVRHYCVDWSRVGELNVTGASFESTSSAITCEFRFDNPHATRPSTVNMHGNDVHWDGVHTLTISESSTGGPLHVNRQDFGNQFVGEDGSITFEGATLNGFETTLTVSDPSADRTFTIPNADSNAVQPTTCGGTDKVSAISSAGVVTCSTDATGSGSGLTYADAAAAVLAGF